MTKYNPKKIEAKWQKYWETHKTFLAKNGSKKPKKYILTEFPYPSGAGLHMGHLRGYVAGDATSRYYRMKGFEVLFPMGWDAFGLPAENFAIKTGVQPAVSTAANIKNAKRQMQSWGLSLDWSREVNTTDPEYYKWTQWLFLKFFEAGLAYEATGLINWCPKDKTGLANEEVINGACERCGTMVEKKELRQWYLKITAYAEKLLKGLEKDLAEWPEQVKLQQENWIGKSTGAQIDFYLNFKKNPDDNKRTGPDGKAAHIPVYTTRPDTIFGATYLVLSPEHVWVTLATDDNHDVLENKAEVKKYIESAKSKSEIERTNADKQKTGVQLKGVMAVNPATGEEIPMFVADYVLAGYGTGAIMAVPAHDERDFEFAQKFKLHIKPVVAVNAVIPEEMTEALIGDGILVNSGKYDGKRSEEVRTPMAKDFGKPKTQYKLRDWVFSRQRYWGEPIPLIHCEKCGIVPVPEKDLPVTLPKVKKYEPTGTGESPLAAVSSWVNVKCPKCKAPAKRETNTMPQWAGSSWYFLRYTDPKNKKAFAGTDALKYWMPVDTYFGGMEHTTLHLLYSRFWNLFFYDQKLVAVKEPFKKRVPHGIILAHDGEKMSKSKGNVVNPDDIIAQYGTDTLRMYEMFLGPHEAQVAWNDKGVIGVRRFLERVWMLGQSVSSKKKAVDSEQAVKALNKLIKKITEDTENFRFNTAVAGFMSFLNEIKDETLSTESFQIFLTLLYPFAPHISEELWDQLGNKKSLQLASWPDFDPAKIVESTVEVVVQVNGKVKDKVSVPRDASDAAVQNAVMASEKIKNALAGSTPKRIIVVKNKLANIVV
jgi:leucyl-tRNA synthetase